MGGWGVLGMRHDSGDSGGNIARPPHSHGDVPDGLVGREDGQRLFRLRHRTEEWVVGRVFDATRANPGVADTWSGVGMLAP